MFQDKVIVITGGAGGIGQCIADEFRKSGAHVCVIDRIAGEHYVGDLADKSVLESFAETVIKTYGRVDVLINNAAPKMCGITSGSYEGELISRAVTSCKGENTKHPTTFGADVLLDQQKIVLKGIAADHEYVLPK